MPFGHDVLFRQSFASRKIVENKPRVLHTYRCGVRLLSVYIIQNCVNIM